MKSVAVYCGSSAGADPIYQQQAELMGQTLARAGLTLVYGGGRVGLMGAIADATLAAGGQVIGVIPGFLADKELAHKGCTELHVVGTMHERKLLMAEPRRRLHRHARRLRHAGGAVRSPHLGPARPAPEAR